MSSVTEPIAAGTWKEFFEPGDFFRLLATTGPVTVEFYYLGRKTVDLKDIEAGYAEYFRAQGQLPFDRVRIYSATTQTVQFVTRSGSDVRYDRGASSVTGTIALDAATLAALEQTNIRPEAKTGAFASTGALSAGGVEVVFTPGANLNGAVVLSADITGYNSSGTCAPVFIGKASPPASNTDGEVILAAKTTWAATGNFCFGGTLPKEQYIPPGVGLYFVSDVALLAGSYNLRACRFKLL